MIPIKQKIERDHRLTRKEWRLISAAGWEEAGKYWHRFLLKKHFGSGAKEEYNYQPRDRKYETRKFFRYGHRRALEYTGNLKRQIMRVRDVRATGDGKRGGQARVVLHGPKYLYQYRKDFNQPNKAAELSAVSREDAAFLAKVLDRVIARELKEISSLESVSNRS